MIVVHRVEEWEGDGAEVERENEKEAVVKGMWMIEIDGAVLRVEGVEVVEVVVVTRPFD